MVLRDSDINEVVKLHDRAVWLDQYTPYDPNNSVYILELTPLVAAFEWVRRNVIRFIPLETEAFSFDFSEVTYAGIAELVEDDYSYSPWETCLLCNDFPGYLAEICRLLDWDFLGYDFDANEEFNSRFASITGDSIDTDSLYDAYIIRADAETSMVYEVITQSDELTNDSDVAHYMEYLPDCITHYYYAYSDKKIHDGRYTYCCILCFDSCDNYLGYESQVLSLPFKIMLARYYARKVILKYPHLFKSGR